MPVTYQEPLWVPGRVWPLAGVGAGALVGIGAAEGGVGGAVSMGAVLAVTGLVVWRAVPWRSWVRIEDDTLVAVGRRVPLRDVRSFTVRTGVDLRLTRSAMSGEHGMCCPPWMGAALWVLTVPADDASRAERWLVGTSRPARLEEAFRQAVELVQPGFRPWPVDRHRPPPD